MRMECRTSMSNLLRYLIEQGYENHQKNLREVYDSITKNDTSFEDFRKTYSDIFGINRGKINRTIGVIRGE